ncbi:low choriolytic enzyme-like [Paramacrobiotus metropolitanus]|uniref:low choriolytic enzyme-like n=1 Tax=Paramacrobiotus metropolitanus TaxID=2943436 RepID=UPI002445B5DC|nr:low choriolytic enzyme-like [Paramacrobiotus metropolitanus]
MHQQELHFFHSTLSVSVHVLVLLSISPSSSFSENIDFAQYIPADDLQAIQSAEISVALSSGTPLYQDDLIGCTAGVHPPCPLQTSRAPYYRLPDGNLAIPYMVEPDVDDALMDDIVAALDDITNQTQCLRFLSVDDADALKVPNNPTIRFASGQSGTCAAEFGGVRSPMHKVYLSTQCISAGELGRIQQLLMLAMGFPHEHVRSDRDEHIIVNWDNVIPERRNELDKNDPGIFDTLPYDYDSLLHPGYVFLAQVASIPTLMAKNKAKIGQRQQLSADDVKKLKTVICQGSTQQAAPRPTPTPTSKPPSQQDFKSASIVTVTVVATKPQPGTTCDSGDPSCATTSVGEEPIQPSLSLPVHHCAFRQVVTLHNTQTMSRTTLYPMKKRFQHSTKFSTWWFGQTEAGATKDYLAQPVEYPQFLGAVKGVSTQLANEYTRIFQTDYEPSVMEDGGTRLQQKIETRIMECRDRPSS